MCLATEALLVYSICCCVPRYQRDQREKRQKQRLEDAGKLDSDDVSKRKRANESLSLGRKTAKRQRTGKPWLVNLTSVGRFLTFLFVGRVGSLGSVSGGRVARTNREA